jgi:transcriptional regulator with XRE-family HTH domain
MKFVEVQTRLLSRIRNLIHNGELTERGFARISGISQPHIHKVLKGARTLSTERFDLLLTSLHWSLLDLFQEAELRNHLASSVRPKAAHTELPLEQKALGPGARWSPASGRLEEHFPVPCSLLRRGSPVVAVRLSHDPSMWQTLGNCNVAALELAHPWPLQAGSLYAVDRGADTVLRRVRRGAACLYLISDEDADQPRQWEVVSALDSVGRPAIHGRVVWLSEETYRKPVRREYGYALPEATSWYVSRT